MNTSAYAFVSMNGEQEPGEDFSITADYYFGTPPGGPPYPYFAVDSSGSFYAYRDEVEGRLYRNGIDYAKFRTHKPSAVTDYSSNLTLYTPPPGKVGARFVYLLQDTFSDGMPGVWIQERFTGALPGLPGAAVPADFLTNLDMGIKWTTQRKGYAPSWLTAPTSDDGVMGVEPDLIFYDPQNPSLLLYHEYWAATDRSAETLATYPIRTVPGSAPPVSRYLGIWLQSFDLIISLTNVTHNVGSRHSPPVPP